MSKSVCKVLKDRHLVDMTYYYIWTQLNLDVYKLKYFRLYSKPITELFKIIFQYNTIIIQAIV